MLIIFWKKINCHDKIPWHWSNGQNSWHFFKIPWQFPDLEKILFFPDFSLTRGNPDNLHLIKVQAALLYNNCKIRSLHQKALLFERISGTLLKYASAKNSRFFCF